MFNIVLNGQLVQANFDPIAAAGTSNTAVDRSYTVNVTTGQIAIDLKAIIDDPEVNAIEITGTGTPPPPPSGFTPIRVNAGGFAYTDTVGQVWAADTGYLAGLAFSAPRPVMNTNDATLYQAVRWNYGTLQYRFPVPNGTYTVKLKFAELTWYAVGQRVFNIVLNGQLAQANFDPIAAAGSSFTAVDRSYAVNVTNGQIAIDLNAVIDNPEVNAIEITAGGTVTPPPTSGFTPIRINAGGLAYADTAGKVWSADTGYIGGIAYSIAVPIAKTNDAPLYQTQRWNYGTLQYRFTVPNGAYNVPLKFAEINLVPARPARVQHRAERPNSTGEFRPARRRWSVPHRRGPHVSGQRHEWRGRHRSQGRGRQSRSERHRDHDALDLWNAADKPH